MEQENFATKRGSKRTLGPKPKPQTLNLTLTRFTPTRTNEPRLACPSCESLNLY